MSLSFEESLKNNNENWIYAIRWWVVLDAWWSQTQQYAWVICWDVKYWWRRYTEDVNDFYPEWDSSSSSWAARHLDLWIVSFCSSYVLHLWSASESSPVWVCYRVRYDTRVAHDPRNVNNPWLIWLELTNDWPLEPGSIDASTTNQWTNTTITCARIWEYPRLRTL